MASLATMRRFALQRRPNLRRMMRGSTTTPATVAAYSTVLLHNSTTQGHYLVVYHIAVVFGAGATSVGTSLYPTPFGVPGNSPTPLTGGDAAQPGTIYQDDASQYFQPDYVFAAAPAGVLLFDAPPLAVLQPNWCLLVQCQQTNAAITVSYIWEALPAQDLPSVE